MARRLRPEERFNETVAGFQFRASGGGEADLWAHTMLRGFFAEPDIPPGWDKLVRPMAQVPDSLATIVWEGALAVACCGGLISREHHMVALGGTSTLPEYRGRGIQTAAIGRRLNQAIAHGCDLAAVVTLGNTTSMRNAERMGFTLAYTKVSVTKAI